MCCHLLVRRISAGGIILRAARGIPRGNIGVITIRGDSQKIYINLPICKVLKPLMDPRLTLGWCMCPGEGTERTLVFYELK